MRIALTFSIIFGIFSYISAPLIAQTAATPVAAGLSIEKVAEGLNLPEGFAWDNNNTIYISNSNSNWIAKHSFSKLDTFVTSPTTPADFKKISGIAVHEDGSIYACDYEKGEILRFTTDGECKVFSPGFEDEKFNRPTDLAFDKDGNLYFTDPKSNNRDERDGRIFMIPSGDSEPKLVFDGLGYPTGIAFSPDGSRLYVSESSLERVIEFQIKKDGTLGSYSEFVELPGGKPAGIAVDTDGNLFVAHKSTGIIYQISSSREILKEIKVKGKNPLNVKFGDADMTSLLITEGDTNSLFKIKADTPGIKLFSSP